MKFELTREVLLDVFKKLKGSISPRPAAPILSNLWIEVTDSAINFRGSNLDQQMTAVVDHAGGEVGKTTASFPRIEAFVTKTPKGGAVKFEVKEDRGLRVSAGRSRMDLLTMEHDDFPDMSGTNWARRFMMPAEQLAGLLGHVDFAMSSESTRYYLNGIYLHASEIDGRKTLCVVATDGHRLAKSHMDLPDGAENMPGIIIPRTAVQDIVSLCDDDAIAEVAIASSAIEVVVKGCRFITKLIDGTFPDYHRVIPRGNDKSAILDRKEMLQIVDRVSTISSERGRAMKMEIKQNKIVMTVTNPDSGVASDEMEAETSDQIEIGFNSHYVCDILSSYPGQTVKFQLGDPGSPALISDPSQPDRLAVLMPMRV